MFGIKDQVALITGGTGALGREIVRVFAAAGAKLVIADRAPDRAQQLFPQLVDKPNACLLSETDVTKSEDMERVVAAAIAQFGKIDILINTVGGYKAGDPVHETPLDTWDLMMDLNARSTFIACKTVLPVMIENGHGRIINVSAKPALQAPANHAAYSASKSAVARLTEAMAAEYKDKAITVNAILPSIIDTPANREAMPKADFSKWVTPEAIAQVMVFLASSAGEPVNGALLPVYGRS